MGVNEIMSVFLHFSLKLMLYNTVDVHIILLHDCECHVNWHSKICTLFMVIFGV
jgi:hypothetical protein